MENSQYINGNKKVLAVLIIYLVCWLLIGQAVKEYMDVRFEEIKNMKDSALALKEMHALHFRIITLPGTFFFLLKAILFSTFGYFILKQGQWPPNNIPPPFKTKIVKGSKSKVYALSYFVGAILSIITIAILWWSWLIII